jgi:hypothetical protein
MEWNHLSETGMSFAVPWFQVWNSRGKASCFILPHSKFKLCLQHRGYSQRSIDVAKIGSLKLPSFAFHCRSNCWATHMIFEAGFWLALVAATRAIAKIHYRRRDVLFGPYIEVTEGSKIGIQRIVDQVQS